MRVLVLVSPTNEGAAWSIARALSLRHEVETFDYLRGVRPFLGTRWNPLDTAWQLSIKAVTGTPTAVSNWLLMNRIRGRRYDLVFVVQINLVPGWVIEEVRRQTGALVVGWFMDSIVNLGKAEFLRAPYERVFLKDPLVVDRFRAGAGTDRVEFLAEAFDPELHRPVAHDPVFDDIDVATYGNSYPYRAAVLDQLLRQREVRAVVFGHPSWDAPERLRKVYRPPVRGHQKSAAMRAVKIAINTHHFSELGGANARMFELCGIGAFQLTDGPNASQYFEPGTEVATFSGPSAALEQVRWFLDRPEERRRIAAGGLERAWSSYTYCHRLNELFSRMPQLAGVKALPVPVGPPTEEGSLVYA